MYVTPIHKEVGVGVLFVMDIKHKGSILLVQPTPCPIYFTSFSCFPFLFLYLLMVVHSYFSVCISSSVQIVLICCIKFAGVRQKGSERERMTEVGLSMFQSVISPICCMVSYLCEKYTKVKEPTKMCVLMCHVCAFGIGWSTLEVYLT